MMGTPRQRSAPWSIWLAMAVVVAALAACSGWEPLEVPDREYPKGRGALSGEDGEFVIYRQ